MCTWHTFTLHLPFCAGARNGLTKSVAQDNSSFEIPHALKAQGHEWYGGRALDGVNAEF